MPHSILITGGSGSFGQAFVADLLAASKYPRIIIYSRDELKQAFMMDRFDDGRMRFFIGDVRDVTRLTRAMQGVDIVVHAAALKRIEVGAYNPEEMVKTNVFGAMNVIEAATLACVKKVVFLSTDKAYQPISPYGQSKALAESLFLNANNQRAKGGPEFAVTRYGNVAGSAGSVIPKWLAADTIVPVTDPECTRFWMSMNEAVSLVRRTISTMEGGELVIPVLPAFRLGDLAAAMGLHTRVIGLGEFEKLHESLKEGASSEHARRMTIPEIQDRLAQL